MPSRSEIKEHLAGETARRGRLSVPAFAGGFLYLLSGILVSAVLKGAPTVGLLQGLTPALRGEANPSVSPRAGEVKFISHHSPVLLIGSFLAAVAITVLTLVLVVLADAVRFRRAEMWALARPLVIAGGSAVAFLSIAHQAVTAVKAHSFATGHNFSNHAVDLALTKGTLNVGVEYLDLLAGLALAAGMIVLMMNAIRVGLLTRWMGVIGIFAGILIFLPIGGATLEVVPAFWLVAIGLLYGGRWPNGDPPAWPDGEARPWPSRAQMRAEAQGPGGRPALATAGADVAPAPIQPESSGRSRKRRRKRGIGG